MNQNAQPTPVAEAIDYLDGDSAVARRAGLKTSWAVAKWRARLPPDRVLWLAEQTGWRWTPHMLSPSIYPNPTDGIPPDVEVSPDHPTDQTQH